jgi:hypothetical protein
MTQSNTMAARALCDIPDAAAMETDMAGLFRLSAESKMETLPKATQDGTSGELFTGIRR